MGGDAHEVLSELYAELRHLASGLSRSWPADSVWQPTVLVHEACLRLFGHEYLERKDRRELLALAATAMRHLLVDRARERNGTKRMPQEARLTLDQVVVAYEDRAVDLVELNEALSALEAFDPQMSRVVQLRFFAGLEMEEIAECERLALRTLERKWRDTRAWLRARIE